MKKRPSCLGGGYFLNHGYTLSIFYRCRKKRGQPPRTRRQPVHITFLDVGYYRDTISPRPILYDSTYCQDMPHLLHNRIILVVPNRFYANMARPVIDICSYRAYIARHLRNRPSGFPTPNLAAPQSTPLLQDGLGLPATKGMTPRRRVRGPDRPEC